jgi:hypothetical protein
MTHDLFKSFAQSFRFSVLEIIISDLREGVFYAKIVCTDGTRKVEVDARPSDAIAIGLRFGVPIYTFEPILSEAGIVLTDADEEESFGTKEEEKKPVSKSKKPNEQLKDVPFEQLKTMLEEALEKEDYERAAKIRDELNKRN